ncbi:SDR family NAD(P)-dependent oxidoreductase [Lentzea albida]|uniref:NAD(P)-dependent dehydrogenase, short-chain alcohol dehydrogenase family n=1 Tax=Lentzea albida TaxID=65499 RepID=A0A1H9MQB7_9PSEU|nr:SDR family oxidoreductase [Lentzea albida]SER25771.1 NAD(P)-dependent dehydrogenase, short-chain alcohol dehydrogenase family [Lentzea albida]
MSSGVIITGASRGIGRATAAAFAERGHRVAVHYSSRRDDARETLAGLAGEGHVLIGGDLSDPEVARGLVAEAVDRLGAVDVLVNNAAVAPSAANPHRIGDSSWDTWTSAWRSMFDVNLLGAVNVTWAVAQHLIDRGAPGSIVNVGSRGAFRGEPDHPAYGASKAALHAFGQSAAVALAPHGISVTSVAPGFVATERQAGKLAGDEGDAVRDQSPFGRVGTPEEIASAIVYLASREAAWSSGAVLDLNGASHLRT